MAISPQLLIEQVRGSAPYLFEGPEPAGAALRYARVLRAYDGRRLDAPGYYELCLSAHWATAGSFLPTDVDNGIRWKLWQEIQPGLIEIQARLVLESSSWDYAPVTARRQDGPDGARLSTHEGTWFSVAVGAYAACREPYPALAAEVLKAMVAEADRETAVFTTLLHAGNELDILRASALIAHNFGDLDRVADQWELPPNDPLRAPLYDAAKPGSRLFGGVLARAGELNRAHMGADNHRHYPLRAPRCLRRAADLLLPVGPFFDDWGALVAKHPALSDEERGEVVRALVDGWTRMHEPPGYGRALAGILGSFAGGFNRLKGFLPGRDARLLSSGSLRTAIDLPRARFEAQWAKKCAKLVA